MRRGRTRNWNSNAIPTRICQIQPSHHLVFVQIWEGPRERILAASPSGSFKLVQSNSVCFLLKGALSEAGGRVSSNPQDCWRDSCVHTVCCTCSGYVLQQHFSSLCHNALACHNSPWSVLKEILLQALKFQSLFCQKDWKLFLYYGNKVTRSHLYSKILAWGRNWWSHKDSREVCARLSSGTCVMATEFENCKPGAQVSTSWIMSATRF